MPCYGHGHRLLWAKWADLYCSLVFDYLMRNGYLATANAMARPSAVPRPSSFSPSVNSALADAESIPVDASASATTTNPALESFSSSPSRSPQSQDLNNGITDQDALDSNSTNTKSSTTQPNPSQVRNLQVNSINISFDISKLSGVNPFAKGLVYN